MKKNLFIWLILFTGFNLSITAQSSLGIDTNFLSYSVPDTTSFNNIDTYYVHVKNYGPGAYSGPVSVFYAVDSASTGLSLAVTDSGSVSMTLAVGSTSPDTAFISINPSGTAAFKSGINTVVIWPRSAGANFTTRDSLKITVWVVGFAGIKNTAFTENTIVFPNPMQHRLFIANKDKDFIIEQVRIFDTSGQAIYTEIFKGSIDVSKLTSGTYTLEFSDKTGKTTLYKVIKE